MNLSRKVMFRELPMCLGMGAYVFWSRDGKPLRFHFQVHFYWSLWCLTAALKPHIFAYPMCINILGIRYIYIYTSRNHINSQRIRTIQFKNTPFFSKLPCPISAEITIIENAMRINVPWIRFSKDSHSWKPPGLPFSKVPLCGERLTRKQSI